jgi:hypothetical protein
MTTDHLPFTRAAPNQDPDRLLRLSLRLDTAASGALLDPRWDWR